MEERPLGSVLHSPCRASATDIPLYLNWKESWIEVEVNESSHASVGLRKTVLRKLEISVLLFFKILRLFNFIISFFFSLSSSSLLLHILGDQGKIKKKLSFKRSPKIKQDQKKDRFHISTRYETLASCDLASRFFSPPTLWQPPWPLYRMNSTVCSQKIFSMAKCSAFADSCSQVRWYNTSRPTQPKFLNGQIKNSSKPALHTASGLDESQIWPKHGPVLLSRADGLGISLHHKSNRSSPHLRPQTLQSLWTK